MNVDLWNILSEMTDGTFDLIYKLYEARDTRLNHMPFIQNPWALVMLITVYLFIVVVGKKCMQHRRPVKIDQIVIAYNLMQIFVNSAMVFAITCYIFVFKKNFSFRCEPKCFATDFNGMFIAYMSYIYFILKLIDYLDTVFFILRKKWSHVSFLHVYHHLLVSAGAYVWILIAPGSQGVLFVYLNCFVHAIMYTYYFISIYKPIGIKPSITMKKNITRLQMIQFCIIFVHLIHVVVIPGCDCGYPKILSFVASLLCLTMLALFANFYRHAYGSKVEHQKIQ